LKCLERRDPRDDVLSRPKTSEITVLITGASGFVGRHLIAELRRRLPERQVVPTDLHLDLAADSESVHILDVTDPIAVAEALGSIRPTHVIHLSGISAPSEAAADSRRAWEINTLGALSVAEGILRRVPECCLIFAGTGLVYGTAIDIGQRFTEASPLAPSGDYAVTKAAADLLLGSLCARGLRSVRLRLFNHTGPGQTEAFVVPRLAAQIARIEAGLQPPELHVGYLEDVRDFLDVRDVVAAYAATMESSSRLRPDAVINIASGTGNRIGEIMARLLHLSEVRPSIVNVATAQRGPPNVLVGDPTLAERLIAWKPRYRLDETLESVLEFWRGHVVNAPN